MKTQTSVNRAHLASILISTGINALLIGALLFFVELEKPPPPPVGVDISLRDETPQEKILDVKEPPSILKDERKIAISDMKFSFPDPTLNTPASLLTMDSVVSKVKTNLTTTNIDLSGVFIERNPLYDGRGEDEKEEAITKALPEDRGEVNRALVRSLDWLQSIQISEGEFRGAWRLNGQQGRPNAGMTGLALLTFLAYGETPASEQYGKTVAEGLRCLVEHQDENGIFQPAGAHTGYGHAIATYAVAEAYAMTRNQLLEQPLFRAVVAIENGMQSKGGFDYDYLKKGRSDNSLNAWHIQALKAALIAQPGDKEIESGIRKTMTAMLALSAVHEDGRGFAYSNSDAFKKNPERAALNPLLSSAGALCLQLTGAGHDRVTTQTMRYVNTLLAGDRMPAWGKNTISSHGGEFNLWYYATQAFFHDNPNGKPFRSYLGAVSASLIPNQSPDGHWDDFSAKGARHGPVYNTTMAALSLMTPFRHLSFSELSRGSSPESGTLDPTREQGTDRDVLFRISPSI